MLLPDEFYNKVPIGIWVQEAVRVRIKEGRWSQCQGQKRYGLVGYGAYPALAPLWLGWIWLQWWVGQG